MKVTKKTFKLSKEKPLKLNYKLLRIKEVIHFILTLFTIIFSSLIPITEKMRA